MVGKLQQRRLALEGSLIRVERSRHGGRRHHRAAPALGPGDRRRHVGRSRRARRAHRRRAPARGLRSLPAGEGPGRAAGRAPAGRRASAVAVFGDVQPDPTLENVNNALAGAARPRGRRRGGDRRRQPDGHGQGGRRGLRQPGRRARLRGLQPGPGPRAAARGGPDDGRNRERGHARGGHHRHRARREDDDARRPPDGPRRDLRLQADDEHAGEPDLVGRRRLAHPRDRGLRLEEGDGAHRHARARGGAADRRAHAPRGRATPTTSRRARR